MNENVFEIKIEVFKISLTPQNLIKIHFPEIQLHNFEFEILINPSEISSKSSRCQIIFNANFSMMIEMMAKKPLENFLTNIAKKIEKLEL